MTARERAVLERLLSADFRDVEFFRSQLEAVTVTRVCSCGCGTLRLAVDPAKAVAAPSAAWRNGTDIIVEGDSQSWLMLFQEDGWLTELEHVAGYGPNPEELDASTITPDVQVEDDWFR